MAKLIPSTLKNNASFAALAEIAEERLAAIDISQAIPNQIDNVDESAVDILAVQFGAWRFREWIYQGIYGDKRAAIKGSISARAIDGTAAAIIASGLIFTFELEIIHNGDDIEARFPDLSGVDWYKFVIYLKSLSENNTAFGNTADLNLEAAAESWKNARSEFLFYLLTYEPDADDELEYTWGDSPTDETDPDEGEDGLVIDLYISSVYQYTY